GPRLENVDSLAVLRSFRTDRVRSAVQVVIPERPGHSLWDQHRPERSAKGADLLVRQLVVPVFAVLEVADESALHALAIPKQIEQDPEAVVVAACAIGRPRHVAGLGVREPECYGFARRGGANARA